MGSDAGTLRPGRDSGAVSTSTPRVRRTGRGAVGRGSAPRKNLLQGDEPGDDCHPHGAHDAQGKERRHEGPTAADAPGAVPHTHAKRARPAVAPRPEKQAERAAALRQTDVLQRGQLVQRRHQECRSRQDAARVVPPEVGCGVPGEHADQEGDDSRAGPRGQLAGDEHHGRQLVPAHLRVQRHRRSHRWEHHRRHHDDPHASARAGIG